MDMTHAPDWSLVQAFLAVAETGSLSAAARRLGTSQPTVGRQVQQLEAQLGVTLFARQARGMALTAEGTQMLPPARHMAEAAGALTLVAAKSDARLEGTVRITASRLASHLILPPILAELRQIAPRIDIELVPSDVSQNLLFREADIAVRMYRPTQLDMVTRHIGDVAMTVCAATSYLERRGRPRTVADLAQHDLIGFDRDTLILDGMRAMGLQAKREDFAVRCDDQVVYWQLLRAGCGIGFTQRGPVLDDPALEVLLPDLPMPQLPIWLTVHEHLRHTPRISRVWDHLAAGLSRVIS